MNRLTTRIPNRGCVRPLRRLAMGAVTVLLSSAVLVGCAGRTPPPEAPVPALSGDLSLVITPDLSVDTDATRR